MTAAAPEPAHEIAWFRRCPTGGTTYQRPSLEDVVTDTNPLADRIAAVLREHSRTAGMAVTMGWTCRCGHWATGKNGDMASDHQATEIAKLLTTEHGETATHNEYQVRHPSGSVRTFLDIGDAEDHHVIYGMGAGPIFERSVTTVTTATEWTEVTG